jgi:hypothetical protein
MLFFFSRCPFNQVGSKAQFKPTAKVSRSAFLHKFQREKRPTLLVLARARGGARRGSAGRLAREALRRSGADYGRADDHALAVARALLAPGGGQGGGLDDGGDRAGRASFGAGEASWAPREVVVATAANDPTHKGKDPTEVRASSKEYVGHSL